MTKEPTPRWSLANACAVPGTGRRHHGHWFRRPRNVAVKRALLSAFGTLRGVPVPPDSWQDIRVKAMRNRNWKRHRLTRWRSDAYV